MTDTYVKTGFEVPAHITKELREYEYCLFGDETLKMLGMKAELWITYEAVRQHTDPQPHGWVTLGLVLLNDNGSKLVNGDGVFDLPVGSVYRIDPSKMHGTEIEPDSDGSFCFLAWDMPGAEEMTAEQFVAEALESIRPEFDPK